MDLNTVSEVWPNTGFEEQPESFYIELGQVLDNASSQRNSQVTLVCDSPIDPSDSLVASLDNELRSADTTYTPSPGMENQQLTPMTGM